MFRRAAVILLLLSGCSSGPDADLPAIAAARSLAAEWAMVNEQSSQGRLTLTYVQTMRDELRQQLEATASELKQPASRYGQEIHTLLAQPADAPPQELRAHAERLKQIEDRLESA